MTKKKRRQKKVEKEREPQGDSLKDRFSYTGSMRGIKRVCE